MSYRITIKNYKMKNLIAVLAIIAVSTNLYASIITDSIRIEGNYRTFHYRHPESNLAGGSLVFILYGSGGNGLGIMSQTSRLEREASNENVLFVYPDGYKNIGKSVVRRPAPLQIRRT
jgi:polyhydroxybutyrate depolymerase